MVKLIEADTRIDAWMQGVDFLLRNGPSYLNLILAIESPNRGGSYSGACHRIDEFLNKEKKFAIHTVAETIFPGWLYRKYGLQGVFEIYPDEVYPLIKKHRSIAWGTYAYRMLRRPNGRGVMINPLEQLIEKMRAESSSRGTKRSCYEINVAEGEYDIPLYSSIQDSTRRMRAPCLSHLSFKLVDGTVHLVAFYRSHDYRHKVPGNLLGLARLQACVARETWQNIGSLVVHSSYAFLDGPKMKMQELLKDIRPNR